MKQAFAILMAMAALTLFAEAEGPTKYEDMYSGTYGNLAWPTSEYDSSMAAWKAAHAPSSGEGAVIFAPTFLMATGVADSFTPQVVYAECSNFIKLSTLIRPGLLLFLR